MTPETHTAFSLILFAALATLQRWLNRRHRSSLRFRHGVAATLVGRDGR
ncbi:MAG TPA: hypothetical protein VMH81_04505 [Bryobacteraceae bacterium]|nr:hypothetical protein [Bryobacteraceae bacterium]